MRKVLSIFALLVAFATFTALKADGNAEFKFEKETYDFGKIPQGKPVSYEFKFTNVGTEPLIISKVESSCGCTVPKYTNAPVKPGEAGSINVTFNAAQAAPFSKSVTIRSNAKTPLKSLYIKGEVVK
ncbi:DUF1573 domain-containing protein [Olivibacter sp. SDN3]|uniref:DUF1573 domain-containing protein n=1 Tax=Olivibacter sp. SDN3 TaxID=2764720 RepID=UPI00165172CE|nr:DUF1573 domain-containing protein [Olivibacter sp. SDN3]QNL48487.1 DUF1573 domain-containing protein [Olivibacter sp. SDN3]